VGSARLMVRYEDLLRDPAAKLVAICGALGLDASRERLEAIARDHSYERVSNADKGGGKEVRAAKPGGWRVNLSAEEQKAMLEIMGEKLAELRYIPAATVPA
jgi:Sulfotransferase domain